MHLFGLRAEYAKSMPIEFEEIAGAVIHHCAPFFLLDDCPQIVFVDGDKELDLNEAFAKLFSGILTSEYLDMKVNANRLSFSFVEENSLFESIEPSRKEIDSKVEECVKDILKDYFDEAVNEREEAVRKYITEEAPQYKPLMKHLPQAIEAKPPLRNTLHIERQYCNYSKPA